MSDERATSEPPSYEARVAEWEALDNDVEAETLLRADDAILQGDFRLAYTLLAGLYDSSDPEIRAAVAERHKMLSPDPAAKIVLVIGLILLAVVVWAVYAGG